MPKPSISSQVLAVFAQELRVVVADWRIYAAYDRVARQQHYVPPNARAVKGLISHLVADKSLEAVDGVSGVYLVTVPYASTIAAPDEAILQEANPNCALSHLTAFAYHGLVDEIPSELFASHYPTSTRRLPLGTTVEDWLDVPTPKCRTPKLIRGRAVRWTSSKAEWDFGIMVGQAQGSAVYVTDLERTLLDALRHPDKCGGILRVLRAWKRAAPDLNADKLVGHVGEFGQTVLRQRAGYVLEQVGVRHPALDDWARRTVRGSSAKLVANRAFVSTHSERWDLSLNAPGFILEELRQD